MSVEIQTPTRPSTVVPATRVISLALRYLDRYGGVLIPVAMCLSFLVALGLAVHAGQRLVYVDEKEYARIARDLVQRHAYVGPDLNLSAYRPPGYPFFLTLGTVFGASNLQLRILNLCLLPVAQLFLFLLARALTTRALAVLAVLLSTLYLVFLYTASVIFPQTLAAVLLLASLWCLLRTSSTPRTSAGIAGLLWGLLILSVPTFAVLGVLLATLLFVRQPRSRSALLLFLGVALLVVSPWTARNYRVFHQFVFVATNGGVNLLLGNSETASATSDSTSLDPKYAAMAHQRPDEVQADRYYAETAKTWMRTHPRQATSLYLAKLLHYFAFADHLATQDGASGSASSRELIMIVTYGPLLLLLGIRVALSYRFKLNNAELCLLALYLLNALLTAVFFTRIRFRLPLDWLLIAFDVCAMDDFLKTLTEGMPARPIVTDPGPLEALR